MRNRLKSSLLLALLLLSLATSGLALEHPPMPPPEKLVKALCVRVVDGDTAWFEFELAGVLTANSVRFLHVDTPETVHPNQPVQFYGPEASAFTTEALLDQEVFLEFDKRMTDRFGRFLAFVWLPDGTLFNLRLVELGYAEALVIRPNRKYEELFWQAHREAHDRKAGLWQKQD